MGTSRVNPNSEFDLNGERFGGNHIHGLTSEEVGGRYRANI